MIGLDWHSLYIAQAFAAAVISASLALYLVPQWRAESARSLLLLMVSVSVWSAAYGMEFKSTGLAAKLWWVRIEYLGAAWTGVFFFRFAMLVTDQTTWVRGLRGALFFVPPALVILAVFTNPHHYWIWSAAWINTDGPVPALAYDRGPVFWVFVAYSYGLLVAGTAGLVRDHRFARRIENRHFWIIMIGVLAPWLSNIVYLMEIESLRHLDLTPAAFTVSGIAFFWGTIRHQMLPLIPIARDAVIESMQDAVLVLDLRNRIIDLNTAARRLLPPPRHPIRGTPLPGRCPELYMRLEQNRADGLADTELTLADRRPDGIWRLRQTPLHSRGGAHCGWLVILQEVTAQKQIEAAVRESEEKFRGISDNALDGILMIDPTGHLSFMNRAAERMFGYQAAEILGQDLHAILSAEAKIEPYRHVMATFRRMGEGPVAGQTLEVGCRRKSGEIFPAELSVAPMRLNDQWHAVAIVRDITRRKQTQAYLVQSEKMLSVGGLAAGMAHEINNPLAGILANVQVMRMRLLGDLPDNLRAARSCGIDLEALWAYMGRRGIIEKVEAIEHSCQRAAAIVRNMLTFARKSDAAFTDNDLAALVDRTVELAQNDYQLASQHDFQKIRIERHYSSGVPPVPCDAGLIQQVVLNILKNGAQAMWTQAGDHPPPRFDLTVGRQDEWASITIADNGPGIPDEIRQRIFEPFFTTKPTGAGTGLGLSIAYFIVTETHAGQLSVSSPPAGGTSFRIRLPLRRSSSSTENH